MFKIYSLIAAFFVLIFGYKMTEQSESVVADDTSTVPVDSQPSDDQTTDPASGNTTIPSDDEPDTTPELAGWDKDFTECPDVQVNQKSKFTPYLQSKTDSSVWVSWKSEMNKGSVVEYSTSPCSFNENSTQTASGSAKFMTLAYFYNTVKIEGLKADQRYYYRVKSGKKVSGIYRFVTSPINGDNQKIRFLVFGDHQSALDKRYQQLVEAAKAKVEKKYGVPVEQSIDFIVNDGDQVQNGSLPIEWNNLHFKQSAPLSANLPIQMTVGNHEYWGDPNLNRYRAFAKFEDLHYAGIAGAEDETYYAYQHGSTLLIHLNSNVDSHEKAEKSREAQTKWLTEVVATAKDDNNVNFIVTVLHHPYRTETQKPASKSMNDIWMDILSSTEKYAMTVSGHHHIYSRGQVVEKPVYHMISGGTGGALSAQWFGDLNSTFINHDELQKTISNWTWQIVEIDPVKNLLTVESYAEGHPGLYNSTRKMDFNSRLIDTFTRELGQIIPEKPAISALAPQQHVNLSNDYTFSSSDFSSMRPEAVLNTTQFQIARDENFQNLVVDKFTNVEDVFGDTGAPHYTPIDLNEGVDILQYTAKKRSLSNGSYHIRVRHRDQNVEWSTWSNAVPFSVTNSKEFDPSTDKNIHSHNGHGHSH